MNTAQPHPHPLSHHRILVVDDEPDIVNAIRRFARPGKILQAPRDLLDALQSRARFVEQLEYILAQMGRDNRGIAVAPAPTFLIRSGLN